MCMRKRTVASVGLLGLASMLAFSSAASAADIFDGPRASSPYDDPRYGDIYQHPAPQPRYAEPRHVEPPVAEPRYVDPPRYAEPRYDAPRKYYDDEPAVPHKRYGYLEPMNPPRYDYSRNERQDYRNGSGCVPHGEIKRSLINEGWGDFRDLEFRGDVAKVQARRPNGQLYVLKVDRCSGEIVNSRPLNEGNGSYGYADRYSRSTY
jgi:hypothetical protein